MIPPPTYPRKVFPKKIHGTVREPTPRRRTRPEKTIPNPNNFYFKEVWTFSVIEDHLPRRFAAQIDNVLTGIALLDLGGNSRPIRKGLLFDMLRDLDEVSTKSVQEYAGFSVSYARKIAAMIRVAVNALNRIVDDDR